MFFELKFDKIFFETLFFQTNDSMTKNIGPENVLNFSLNVFLNTL